MKPISRISDADLVFDTVFTLQSLLISRRDIDILLPIYLPVTREIPHETRHDLAMCEDFSVRQTFTKWLHLYGTREDLSQVERLATDEVDQVARPAKQAAAKLRCR